MTLADDEDRLADIADELAVALARAVPSWIERVTTARLVEAGIVLTDEVRDRLGRAGGATAAAVAPELQRVLTADVDAAAGSPLAVLRDGVGPATALLTDLGVPPPPRDDFARRAFPDDAYELGPATFADVDESLQDLGLMWGAARAHVHLRRRQERDS